MLLVGAPQSFPHFRIQPKGEQMNEYFEQISILRSHLGEFAVMDGDIPSTCEHPHKDLACCTSFKSINLWENL
jgi:hypothetical protein